MNIIRIPDSVRIITNDDNYLLEKSGAAFVSNDVKVSFGIGETLSITLTADKTPVRYLGLRFNGSFDKGTRFLGDVLERSYADLAFRGFESENIMYWYCIAASSEHISGYGVKTGGNAIVTWTTDTNGITLWLDVRCGGLGVVRNGVPFVASEVVCMEENKGFEDAFDFIHRFCQKMCDNPIFPKVPIYGSNNWYYAYGNSSAKEILVDTDILADCSKGLKNRPYMVIDDCWQPLARVKGSAHGRPIPCGNELFPDMKGLADAIKAKDIHPGIWFRPLKTEERFIDPGLLNPHDSTFLDPTVPEALALIAEDTERLTGEWGFELIKYDFVTRDLFGYYGVNSKTHAFSNDWSFRDTSKTGAMIAKDVSRTIFEHSNGATIIGCNVIGHLAAGYIHIHRSGDDTSGVCFDRSVAYGVNALAFRLPQHKAFFDIDADCVCITDKIDWDFNRDFLELYSLSGTPLFVSVAPANATPEVRKALAEAYKHASVQGNDCRPLDWFDNNIPAEYSIDGKHYSYSWYKNGKPFPYAR